MAYQTMDINVYYERKNEISNNYILSAVFGQYGGNTKIRFFNTRNKSCYSENRAGDNNENRDVYPQNLFSDNHALIFLSLDTHSSNNLLNEMSNNPYAFKNRISDWWGKNGFSDQNNIRTAIADNCYDFYDRENKLKEKKKIAEDSVKTFVQAIKGWMSINEFNRAATGNEKSINYIRSEFVKNQGYGSYLRDYLIISCTNLALIKRAKKFRVFLNGEYINTLTFDRQDIYMNEGFFYNAGYYQKVQVGEHDFSADILTDENLYVQFNTSSSASGWTSSFSGPASNTSQLSSGNYYKLFNQKALNGEDAPYYISVSQSGDNILGGIGDAISSAINFALPTFNPIVLDEVDYSTAAEADVSKYVYDFSKYKVNFVPFKNSKTDIDLNKSGHSVVTFKTELKENGVSLNKTRIRKTKFIVPEKEMFQILDEYMNDFSVKLIIQEKTNKETITLTDYFTNNSNRGKYDFIYVDIENNKILNIDFKEYLEIVNKELKYIDNENNIGYGFNAEISLNQQAGELNIRSLELFEAFTRGRDFIEENYTIVRPQERDSNDLLNETSRCMNYDDNYFTYKYSGRDIDIFCHKNKEELYILPQDYKEKIKQPVYCALIHSADLLLESDVTLGDTYGEQKYFIEAVKIPNWIDNNAIIKKENGTYDYIDTFKMTNYLEDGIDPTLYTEADLEIVTAKIDLLQCKYYEPASATFENNWCDCSYGGETTRECIYQKLGYCPYRFESEKHPRRIRTLRQSKSNRFNLIQELCKTFKFYPYFYIEHEKNGKVKLDENGNMLKHIFFMTEKGNNNAMGFRYEKNLSNTTRTIDSAAITTKLYVESVDSSYANDGLCSIQTATDNISRNSYILDFSYYIKMGMLDADTVQRDLYGIDANDFAFLSRIGKFNEQYDEYSNLIITMTGQTLNELEAEIIVSTTGVTTALEERKKIAQQMYQFKASSTKINPFATNYLTDSITIDYKTSDTYKNYLTKYREQATILWGLIETLFFSNNYFSMPFENKDNQYNFYTIDYTKDCKEKDLTDDFKEKFNKYRKKYCKGELFWRLVIEGFDDDDYKPTFDHWTDCMEAIVDTKLYEINGKLGEYRSLYNEVQYWKRERAKILNKINDLSEQFYKKYEPFLKEGTFTDSNFLTDNEYYWGGVNVLSDSCKPKLTYSFSVVDISSQPEYEDDYVFELADTTTVEDIDFFGINKHTGFPNKEKVLITELTENLDQQSKNSIGVKNYTSSFDDLFGSITASVQSLTYNENIYKRASNFTAQQYVTTESLQDTLDIGDLTLLDTAKQNIQLDEEGTEGNDINNTASQYKQTGEGIFFSTDGGETWDLGIGPKGINMDYAKFGSLDASKIQIVDGEYIYFLWDKDGINAYRNPAASTEGLLDFARFNRYGLSLIEKGNVRLRAGYEYQSNEFGSNLTGDYSKEIDLKDQNIGFYLYNDSGQPIFKTETQSTYNDDTTDYSARLSLTGEMFVTNKVLDSGATGSNANIQYKKLLSTQYLFDEKNQITVYTGENGYSLQSDYEKLLKFNGNFELGNYIIFDSNGNIPTKLNFNESYSFYYINNSYYLNNIDEYPDTKFVEVEWCENCSFYTSDNTEQTEFDISFFTDNINTALQGFTFEVEYNENEIINVRFNREESQAKSYKINMNEQELQLININNLLMIEQIIPSATKETENQNIQKKEIQYYEKENDTFVLKTISLYTYQDSGTLTYWENYDNTSNQIGAIVGDFSLSEVGVFINNKKALGVNAGKIEDKTNSNSQEISSDKNQANEAIAAILSGAERTFTITAGGTDQDGNFVYKNILSVLKNGALYMGGVITDYYGKSLDIASLSYLPDEIRINQPSLILTNAGQIWCDWDKFFGIVTDENNNWGMTTNSLKSVLDQYNDAISSIANNLNNYFSNLTAAYGGSSNGYYIDDPSST